MLEVVHKFTPALRDSRTFRLSKPQSCHPAPATYNYSNIFLALWFSPECPQPSAPNFPGTHQPPLFCQITGTLSFSIVSFDLHRNFARWAGCFCSHFAGDTIQRQRLALSHCTEQNMCTFHDRRVETALDPGQLSFTPGISGSGQRQGCFGWDLS